MTKKVVTILFLTGIIIFLASAICSCRSVRYVPVESNSYVKDSVNLIDSIVIHYETRTKDSVCIKDSTVIVQDKDGNIIKEKYYRETERYSILENDYNKLKQKYEKLKAEKVDTIRVPYPVEAKLTKWQQFKMEAGGYAIALTIITILIVVGYMVYKLKK